MNKIEYKSRPSARKHKIILLRDEKKNESGFIKTETKEHGPYWASVVPLSERLRTQYQSISVSATHTVTISGCITIYENDKIKFKNRILDILTIKDPDENGRDKIIITQEIR